MRFSESEIVCVVGLGYIGLPTAAFMANESRHVVGVDTNRKYVEKINSGQVPFYEPDFAARLKTVVDKGWLQASVNTPRAGAYIVAVPTPFDSDHQVDSSFIFSAAEEIAHQLEGGELIVLESTSPPGLTETLAEYFIDKRPDLTLDVGKPNSIYVAHCPERVLPGKIVEEIIANDRVIGGVTPEASRMAADLYSSFSAGRILITDAITAELTKLTENAFRDVNIAFANELSLICDRLGVDVWELIELANHHPRVDVLKPGPGVGGHCIAVDPWFIVSAAPEESKLLKLSRQINDSKPDYVIDKVLHAVSVTDEPKVAILGLAFKANIDDLRESPAVEITDRLARQLPRVPFKVVDANIDVLPTSLSRISNVELVELYSAIADCNIILGLVEHHQFRDLDPKLIETKTVIDTKGIWNPHNKESI